MVTTAAAQRLSKRGFELRCHAETAMRVRRDLVSSVAKPANIAAGLAVLAHVGIAFDASGSLTVHAVARDRQAD